MVYVNLLVVFIHMLTTEIINVCDYRILHWTPPNVVHNTHTGAAFVAQIKPEPAILHHVWAPV